MIGGGEPPQPPGPVRPGLDALIARLPPRPLTRFAPSPTGHLHLGHVVNAVYVWGLAAAIGGRVLLRIEDHDRERSRPEYEASILEDLAWLGLEPDAFEPPATRDVSRQSDRTSVYASALERLRSLDVLYACACSRRDIEMSGGALAGRAVPEADRRDAPAAGGELRYPGTCRNRGLGEAHGRGLRVRMDEGVERFEDALLGPQRQDPAAQCGDILVRDRLGQWTYQFAVTVDDTAQGIDLVIRGADLLASTGRQIRLARLLGREEPPVFLHHPLLFGGTGLKLSKSEGDTGIRELRRRGLPAPDVLGLAAARCGLMPSPTPIQATDLSRLFRPSRRRAAPPSARTPPGS